MNWVDNDDNDDNNKIIIHSGTKNWRVDWIKKKKKILLKLNLNKWKWN